MALGLHVGVGETGEVLVGRIGRGKAPGQRQRGGVRLLVVLIGQT